MVHENKKYKINWGDCNVWVTSKLVLDYNKEWKKHWLLNHVDELFHKRIFKEELEEHRIELYRDTYRFVDAIKKFFKLKTWLPEEELQRFYPEKGIGEGV